MTVDSPLAQEEIFGRFVLLEQLDAHGAETCRAVDLDRELQPIVTVRRLPRWGSFAKRERAAFEAAQGLRAKSHGELLAHHVDAGVIGGVPYWAAQYVPGVSLDRLIERAVDRGRLSRGLALTAAYCATACLVDLGADHTARCDNVLVAPLVHPRRFIMSWTGKPFFLGTSYEQSAPDDEERRFTPPLAMRRAHPGADAYALVGLFFELCTGLPFASSLEEPCDLDAEGPLGQLPQELRHTCKSALRLDDKTIGTSARELLHVVEPLMKAAGGGHFSEVASELSALCEDLQQEEALLLEKEGALAHRLRKRLLRAKSSEQVTAKMRLRPASQEGPALLAEEPESDALPDDMVFVSGGRYLFGTTGELAGDAVPPSYVDVPPFLVDKHPVTTRDFFHYVQAAGAPMPAAWGARYPAEQATSPVVGVQPSEAEAYARWAGKRLLTEIEWELAARGFDGRSWPWGHAFERARMVESWTRPWQSRTLSPVGQHSPDGDSPFGVADLGQAWEWTSTSHPAGGRVVRGGPWRNRREPPTVANRSREECAAPDVTFRCAKSVDIPRIGLAANAPGANVDGR